MLFLVPSHLIILLSVRELDEGGLTSHVTMHLLVMQSFLSDDEDVPWPCNWIFSAEADLTDIFLVWNYGKKKLFHWCILLTDWHDDRYNSIIFWMRRKKEDFRSKYFLHLIVQYRNKQELRVIEKAISSTSCSTKKKARILRSRSIRKRI